MIFFHGGPGIHCAHFELALGNFSGFSKSNIGWICFDQRGCGRSQTNGLPLTHEQNIKDSLKIIDQIQSRQTQILGLCGHSYGAWLMRDVALMLPVNLKCIALGISHNLFAPRNRSLLMDLIILKFSHPERVAQIKDILNGSSVDNIWERSKDVRSLMASDEDRENYYWGNLSAREQYRMLKVSGEIKSDPSVYREVRESLYKKPLEKFFRIEKFGNELLWINGFHDFLMSGENPDHSEIQTFFHSGHYPHIEENELFMEKVNDFFSK